jgi:hypothetical protein
MSPSSRRSMSRTGGLGAAVCGTCRLTRFLAW